MSSSPTHNDTIETAKPTRYTFEFIRNMKTERDDLTEYFR
jgi:hypothetical protein